MQGVKAVNTCVRIHFVSPAQESVRICIVVPHVVVPAVDKAELELLALKEGRGGCLGGGLVVAGRGGAPYLVVVAVHVGAFVMEPRGARFALVPAGQGGLGVACCRWIVVGCGFQIVVVI
jgi:hypothetical protein